MTIQPDLFDRKPALTAERLRELVHYDPETGVFTWRQYRRGMRKDKSVGHICSRSRFRTIRIDYCPHLACKLAWMYVTGVYPPRTVCHINGQRHDDRFQNLALAPGDINAPLTLKHLKKHINYDRETGHFRWRVATQRHSAGASAGSRTGTGYLAIRISGKQYPAAHLAWLYVTGALPRLCIDHINGDINDNRIANLREASPKQNSRNRGRMKNNTSGTTGVSRKGAKWRAFIGSHHIGYFDCIDDAIVARKAAERKHFGKFVRSEATVTDES